MWKAARSESDTQDESPNDAGIEASGTSPTSAEDGKCNQKGVLSRRRTARACEGCRKKKIACNGKQPCTACTVRGRDCVYTALTVTGRPSKGAVRLLQRQIEHLECELAQAKRKSADSSPRADQVFPTQPNSFDPGSFSFNVRPDDEGQALRPEAVRNLSEECHPSHSRYTSSGLDAAAGRSTKLVEDFMFMERTFDEGLSMTDNVTDENYRRQMDLHTSFRLERCVEGEYVAESGWFISAFKLEQCLSVARTDAQHNSTPHIPCSLPATFGPTDDHPEMHVPSQVKLHWPSREREDQMTNVYFRLVHPMLPILCKETLDAQRKGPLRSKLEGDSIWLSIMLGVFIAAARYMPSEHGNLLPWWTARSWLDSHHIAQGRSVGGVQNFLLSIAIRASLFVEMQLDWAVVGLALRSMQDRGLHRECVLTSKYPNERHAGILRCLWWTAQRVEVDRCAWSGRHPTAISFDVLPPRSHALASPIPYFNASLKGLPMLVRVMDREYMVNSTLRTSVLRDVNAWLAELLEFFAFVPTEKDDEKFMASSKLWIFVNMIISYSHRPAVLMLSRKIRMDARQNTGAAWKPEPADEECMREFAVAQKHIKESLVRTVAVLRALILRGTSEITFVDDELMANMGGVMLHGGLLYFAESMLDDAQLEDTVLQCLDETHELLEQCHYPGALFARARSFLASMTGQVKSHSKTVREQRNAKRALVKRRCDDGARMQATSSVARLAASYLTMEPSASTSYTEPEAPQDPSVDFACLRAGNVCRTLPDGAEQAGLQNGGSSTSFDPQGWYPLQTLTTARFSPPQRQEVPSLEKMFWDDLLQNEMMILDTLDHVGFAQRQPPPPPPKTQSAMFPQQRTAQVSDMAQQNAMAGILPPSAQVPSFWLGPLLDHDLSPPKT